MVDLSKLSNTPLHPPVIYGPEIIQSTVLDPSPSLIRATKQRDGSWEVVVYSEKGIVNTLRIPTADKLENVTPLK